MKKAWESGLIAVSLFYTLGVTFVIYFAVVMFMIFIVGCSDIPTPGILDKLIYQDQNTTCFDDGFDTLCITATDGSDGVDGVDGKNGIDGVDGIGKDGIDGRDGRDGIDGYGIDGVDGRDGRDGKDGRDGRDGTTTIVHVTEFQYIDVPIPLPPAPAPAPEPEPTPIPKRIVAEAVIHPSGSVHPIPAETLNFSDTVIHVSHLSDATHTVVPTDDKIWHIAIYEPPQSNEVDLYVYPRSLPPNDRAYFHEGEGTELQGTREGVNRLLRMFLEEHDKKIGSALGNKEIIDPDLR